jgi:hypothetical protein
VNIFVYKTLLTTFHYRRPFRNKSASNNSPSTYVSFYENNRHCYDEEAKRVPFATKIQSGCCEYNMTGFTCDSLNVDRFMLSNPLSTFFRRQTICEVNLTHAPRFIFALTVTHFSLRYFISIILSHHHHYHRPINVPTAGEQDYGLLIRRAGHNPSAY